LGTIAPSPSLPPRSYDRGGYIGINRASVQHTAAGRIKVWSAAESLQALTGA